MSEMMHVKYLVAIIDVVYVYPDITSPEFLLADKFKILRKTL